MQISASLCFHLCEVLACGTQSLLVHQLPDQTLLHLINNDKPLDYNKCLTNARFLKPGVTQG